MGYAYNRERASWVESFPLLAQVSVLTAGKRAIYQLLVALSGVVLMVRVAMEGNMAGPAAAWLVWILGFGTIFQLFIYACEEDNRRRAMQGIRQ